MSPAVVGFSVQDAGTASSDRASSRLEGELCLAHVETDPWPARSHELFGEIAVALLELMDDEPEALELLRGRTFARTLH